MKILDISLLVTFIVVIYLVYKSSIDKSTEQFNFKKLSTIDKNNKYDEDPTKYIDAILKHKKIPKVNSFFQDTQFNQNYCDTMDAFNLLCDQVPLFNRSELPVKEVKQISSTEIKNLISNFIKELNKTVKNHVSDNRTLNGWDTNLPDKKFESGWDKHQKSLGLQTSVYDDPAPKSSVKLIKLDQSQKLETDGEIKYVIGIIIQKQNVPEQMVIRISFVVDKQDFDLDREFFSKSKNTYKTAE